MSVNLTKGGSIDLTKAAGGAMNNLMVGLGWGHVKAVKKGGFLGFLRSACSGQPADLDSFVVLCRNGHFCGTQDLVYYGHLGHQSGAVKHHGDDLVGGGKGDCEQITLDMDRLPKEVNKLIIGVNIYRSEERKQTFGCVEHAYVRIFKKDSGEELVRYDLGNEFSSDTAVICGELARVGSSWQFNAVGQGTYGSIEEIANRF